MSACALSPRNGGRSVKKDGPPIRQTHTKTPPPALQAHHFDLAFPITQGDHFYIPRWTFFVDRVFVGGLLQAQRLGLFDAVEGNYMAVVYATDNLNLSVGEYFSHAECHTKLTLLRKRYCIFRSLLKKTGVTYDTSTNYMHYAANVFTDILQREQFARAYHIFGDPMWPELEEIFRGTQPGPTTEIVDLTSNTDVFPKVEASNRVPTPFVYKLVDEAGSEDRRSNTSVNQRAMSSDPVDSSRIFGKRSP